MHDRRPTSAFCFESSGDTISYFCATHTTVVHNIQLSFSGSLRDSNDLLSTSPRRGFLAVRMIPHPHRLSGDGVYGASPSIVLTSFPLPPPPHLHGEENGDVILPPTALPQRWRVEGGTMVLMAFATDQSLAAAQRALGVISVPWDRFFPHRVSGGPSASAGSHRNHKEGRQSGGGVEEGEEAGQRAGQFLPSSSLPQGTAFFPESRATRIRLHGKIIGPAFAAGRGSLLRPFLCHRWWELKSGGTDRRTGTVSTWAPPRSSGKRRRGRSGSADHKGTGYNNSKRAKAEGTEPPSVGLRVGQVREAFGVSADGKYIHWTDGSSGLFNEVQPFSRFFVLPASVRTRESADETFAIVQCSPNAGAPVVGKIPARTVVEAVGLTTETSPDDDGREESTYVLVYLSPGSGANTTQSALSLLYESPGRCLWGWVRVARRSGDDKDATRLLKDVSHYDVVHNCHLEEINLLSGGSCGHGGDCEIHREGHGPLYTVVGLDRGVRIRSAPSLLHPATRVLGIMQPNEVKEAVERVEIVTPAACREGAVDTTTTRSSSTTASSTQSTGHVDAEEKAGSTRKIFVKWRQEKEEVEGGYSLVYNGMQTFLRELEGTASIACGLLAPTPSTDSSARPYFLVEKLQGKKSHEQDAALRGEEGRAASQPEGERTPPLLSFTTSSSPPS